MTEDNELSVSEFIIAFVRDARPLWDMHDRRYHDNNLKNNLWIDISRQINIDVETLKKKWKNLRDRFVKCLKERKGKSGQAATKQKEWALVEHLSFLKDILSPRSTTESCFQPSQPSPALSDTTSSEDLPGCQEITSDRHGNREVPSKTRSPSETLYLPIHTTSQRADSDFNASPGAPSPTPPPAQQLRK